MSGFPPVRERIALRQADDAATARLAAELSIPSAVARVLSARNLVSFDECRAFFRPSIEQFNDPFLFSHMERAVIRIVKALDAREKIVVYGDYDVDGITATVIMLRVLRQLGAQCDYYLPNRLIEGYGLSEEGVRKIAQSGATLLITVDCGISSRDEVAVAACLGIDCIVTDHHEFHHEPPAAFAILDPKNPQCVYPYRYLAGVGVALKLCQALAIHLKRGEELWRPYLDLAALGTAADIVPMTRENRVIARLGFEQMTTTVNRGLRALMARQGLAGKPLSTSQVVFQLAPCINAVGRLGDPRAGAELLLTDDDSQARRFASQLRDANLERRELDRAVAEEAYAWFETNADPARDAGLVAGSENWHAGVIGIVASKIVERYHRPAILFAVGPGGYARGSGRSIPSLHLLEALNKCADLLEGYGGHAAAAGMTIKTGAIGPFRERFNEVVGAMTVPDDFIPVIMADAEAGIPALTPKFFRIIKQMEPFGPGNMRPVFLARDVRHRAAPRLVGSTHLKMSLLGDGIVMDAIGFNFGDRYREVKDASTLSVAYTIDRNEWNGKVSLQMKVKGIAL
ncbi:MAG: single-stranded-DNA-specific exonuclease RecJ [Chitinispirillaceae bacterium]|nr:single-stranded-DNA-specific exonuclease RecJ [Chitinispirillaceae bacterium]